MLRPIICLSLALLAIAPAWGQPLQTFTSNSGAIAFRYPQGWNVITTDRQPSRYIENYAVQPAGQDFTGRPGQVVVRIFDPMYVVEEARVRLPATPEVLFQRFVQAMPGGSGATFGRRTYGGMTYLFASDTSNGFETDYAAISVGGYLNVAGMAASLRDAPARLPLLFQTVASMSTPWPSRPLDGAGAAVKNWYRVLRLGDSLALPPLACSQAQMSLLLMSFASPESMDLVARASQGFDFSGLRFQTVASGARGSVVRVGGNIAAANGSVTPIYQNGRILGGSNSLFVKLENGAWKVCGPVRGGYR